MNLYADNYKLYSTGFSSGGGYVKYENGTLSWTGTGDNVMTAITLEQGVLSKFSKIKFTCSNLTSGAKYRVIATGDNINYLVEIDATGDVEINISDLVKQWSADKITAEQIATITSIRMGGGTSGSPSTESPYELTIDPTTICIEADWETLGIDDADDWTFFSKLVSSGASDLTVSLNSDVTVSGNTMIGTSTKKFSGIFNGNGNKLTVAYNSTAQCAAPFSYVKDATIQNLKVAGTIESSSTFAAGVVGEMDGTTIINNCQSSVDITSTMASGDSNTAGIAGINLNNSTITVTNCLFDGSITAPTGADAYCGIVGYLRTGTLNVSNNLVLGTFTGGNGGHIENIYRTYQTVTASNNYYKNKFRDSSTNGTNATEAMLISGEVAYNLQGTQTTQYWGQSKLNTSMTEVQPKLSSNAADKVVKLSMTNGSSAEYANVGGVMPSPVDKKALSFNNGQGGDPFLSFNADGSISRCFNKYSLIVSSAGATTLVLPVDVTTLPEGVKAYELTYTGGGEVTAFEVTSITANKPVLINAEAGTYVFVSDNSTEITYDTENAQVNGALNGIFTDSFSYVPTGSYVLQNGSEGIGFYKVSEADPIKITSFRAYLNVQSNQAALRIVYPGDATGIEAVEAVADSKDDAYYTLSGVRVSHPVKGLYIKNGKKVMVK